MEQFLKCPVCNKSYDLKLHFPLLLPTCGHSLCLSCIQSQVKTERRICPEDGIEYPSNQSITELPANQIIIKLLSSDYQICKQHQKQLELVCLDDKEQICVSCALFGEHKNHNYKTLEEVILETEQVVSDSINLFEQIKPLVSKFQDILKKDNIQDQFNKIVNSNNKLIDDYFNKLIDHILSRKLEFKEEFKSKVNQMEKAFNQKIFATIQPLLEKANLWIISTEQKLLQFSKDKHNITLNFFQNIDMVKIGNSLLNELEINYQTSKQKIDEISDKQLSLKGQVIQDSQYEIEIIDQKKKSNNSIILSSLLEETNILLDQSIAFSEVYESAQKSESTSDYFTPRLSQNFFQSQGKRKKYYEIIQLLSQDQFDMIDLSNQEIGMTQIEEIAEIIEKSQNLRKLKLKNNKITDELVLKLLHHVNKSKIEELSLEHNLITEKIFDFIAEKKKQVKLKLIHLESNLIKINRCKKKIEELKQQGLIVKV